jgi:murein DD-endopeptidase MepM/ murein hydrolase activator NlpD
LATHGWALALALMVLSLAPLGFHQPVADAGATGNNGGIAFNSRLEPSSLQAPSTPEQTRQLPPPVSYRAKPGDSVSAIAAEAGITTATLLQINHLSSPALKPGERLIVPPVDGTMVTVDPNQSLALLAQTFQVDPETLRVLNRLGPKSRTPRQLFVPSIRSAATSEPTTADDPAATREHVVRFVWPTKGVITQGFWQYHPGVDIANDVGTPEVAAAAGKVVWAGWGDYGIYVEIDHSGGFQTVYGHMSQVLVSVGQTVSDGQEIGLMGATGRATGPHLHFEIRYMGVPQNPLDLLPQGSGP